MAIGKKQSNSGKTASRDRLKKANQARVEKMKAAILMHLYKEEAPVQAEYIDEKLGLKESRLNAYLLYRVLNELLAEGLISEHYSAEAVDAIAKSVAAKKMPKKIDEKMIKAHAAYDLADKGIQFLFDEGLISA